MTTELILLLPIPNLKLFPQVNVSSQPNYSIQTDWSYMNFETFQYVENLNFCIPPFPLAVLPNAAIQASPRRRVVYSLFLMG